jgi:hypothetical protein
LRTENLRIPGYLCLLGLPGATATLRIENPGIPGYLCLLGLPGYLENRKSWDSSISMLAGATWGYLENRRSLNSRISMLAGAEASLRTENHRIPKYLCLLGYLTHSDSF